MKTIIRLVLISILIPISTYATSGACSYHGGVDCTKKYTQVYAVCNDGWVNSSVKYSDMQECRLKLNICIYPTQTRCDVSDIERLRDNELGSNRAINARSGLLGSSFAGADEDDINKKYSDQISACEAQNSAYESRLDQYDTCLETNAELSRKDTELFNTMMQNIVSKIENKENTINDIKPNTESDFIDKKQGVGLTLDQLLKMGATPVSKASQPVKTVSTLKNNTITKSEVISTTSLPVPRSEIISTTTNNTQIPKKVKWYQKIFKWFYR